ncbi:MAG: hypothetical protein OEL79_11325 [Chromatiales bacterium]|nr:hypothetical protein [Chromatiales bacterium]
MNWIKDIPREDGFYWVRDDALEGDEGDLIESKVFTFVEANQNSGVMMFRFADKTSWHKFPDSGSGYSYSEKITPPKNEL